MKFMFSKSYNLSPINLNIESKSLNLRGLKIQLFQLNGKYFFLSKIFNLNSLEAKIGDGNINLQGKFNQSKKMNLI